jgi:hypothetical protein
MFLLVCVGVISPIISGLICVLVLFLVRPRREKRWNICGR